MVGGRALRSQQKPRIYAEFPLSLRGSVSAEQSVASSRWKWARHRGESIVFMAIWQYPAPAPPRGGEPFVPPARYLSWIFCAVWVTTSSLDSLWIRFQLGTMSAHRWAPYESTFSTPASLLHLWLFPSWQVFFFLNSAGKMRGRSSHLFVVEIKYIR